MCIRDSAYARSLGPEKHPSILGAEGRSAWQEIWHIIGPQICLLYTSDAADERSSVDLGGRRIIKTHTYTYVDD